MKTLQAELHRDDEVREDEAEHLWKKEKSWPGLGKIN